jgi:myo-inositol-1(or 4)-monophosphatase
MYSVLMGLEIEGIIRVGVAYFPAMAEMIAAASGRGCWWNGRPARVSDVSRLEDGILAHSDAASFEKYGRGEAWARLKAAAGFRAGWSDAYGYLLLATGRVEVMLDPIMNSWDCAPFPVILQEAGGYFGDWDGQVTIYAGESMGANAALLPQLLDLIHRS